MPWCQRCKAEYREGFDTCADCGEKLVQALPEEPEAEMESVLSEQDNSPAF